MTLAHAWALLSIEKISVVLVVVLVLESELSNNNDKEDDFFYMNKDVTIRK